MNNSKVSWAKVLVLNLSLILLVSCSLDERKPFEDSPQIVVPANKEFKEPSSKTLEAVEQFRNQFPKSAISMDYTTGRVKMISNFIGPVSSSTDKPEISAQYFINKHAELFGLDTTRSQLKVNSITEAKGEKADSITSRFVRFDQVEYWNKKPIKVYHGEIVVHLTSNNRVHTIHSAIDPVKEVQGDLKIKSDEAVKIVKAKLGNKPVIIDTTQTGLIIYPRNEIGLLCWRVVYDHWLGIINAENGEIILLKDNARYVDDARVYVENPVVNSSTQILPVTNLDGSGTLSGSRFRVINHAEALEHSAVNEFRVMPSDVNFDDQMVYYHMEHIASYFDTELDAQVPASPTVLPIHTRATDIVCNAYYDPDNFLFAFTGPGELPCDGDECKASARYADIIYHEYTHRVQDQLIQLNYDRTESGSIHEGTADYYSGSILDNGCNAEYWIEGRSCLRDAAHHYEYPGDMDSEPHEGGKVWASALWSLRLNIGQNAADRAIREGMRGLPRDADFTTFASSIIVNGAAYYTNMFGDDPWVNALLAIMAWGVMDGAQQAFCAHGIPVSYGPFIDMVIRTPQEDHRVTGVVIVPAGFTVDETRGCKGGFDILGANSWDELDYFYDNKSDLDDYEETLTNTSLTVTMKAPDACESIRRVRLIYRLYYSD